MIRVLLADDHAILRGGLKEILIRHLEGVECGEAGDAEEVLVQVREHPWDLLILDITMPGRSGLDILADLKLLRPELPVLILSMLPEDQFGKRVLKAGARGYLKKESAPEELIHAIRKVLVGGRYVSPTLAEKLARDLQEEGPLHEALSPREFEVLVMIGSGKSVSQVAEELHLSGTTVSTHRAHILEKMKMTTTAEMIRYAVRHHLVD
ncbi:MAG TPA: response regulator transcription factor [Bryobacteraceae bacterium]|jgi:two-component system invasion response regulator UvrY|nr:response regulator transcription factor [Bryobacteraceae bacterium]